LENPSKKVWNQDGHPIIYGNNRYVMVALHGHIETSTDFVSWTRRYSGTDHHLYSVIYGNNQFVAVGINGVILTSPDGITWTQRSSKTTKSLWSIAYGNDRFVALGGYGGTIITSKADNTGLFLRASDSNPSQSLSITAVSNCLFIQIPHTGNFLKENVRISLFNAAGKTVSTTETNIAGSKFVLPIIGLSRGIFYVKITSRRNFEYFGSVVISQ
jgi:hypothetical protein